MESKGGITAMISLINSNLPKEIDCLHVDTFSDRSKIITMIMFVRSVFTLFWYLISNKVDIVHINSSSGGSFFRKAIIANICRLFKVDYIFHIHSGAFVKYYDTASLRWKNIISTVLSKAKCVISISEYYKKEFSLRFKDANIILLGNSSTFKFNKKLDLSRKFELKTLAYCGRISKNKGFIDYCRLIRLLQSSGINVKGIVAGVANDATIFEDSDYLQVANVLQFRGWLNQNQLADLYEDTTCTIIPSYFEAFGLTALESCIAATPIVAYKVHGIQDIVFDTYLADIGDVQGLSMYCQELLTNFDSYCDYAYSLESVYEVKFSLEVYMKRLLEIYYA
ncbi:glycosyltransferase [Vibrio sp. F12]|uniref:glycosyltransferase family 4 protein n=1 Tax=Vibrio sp. F12 TaxID=2070776 RepID=UPI0014837FAA|nr:glycosyltransferase [Vibrio sp. F12]